MIRLIPRNPSIQFSKFSQKFLSDAAVAVTSDSPKKSKRHNDQSKPTEALNIYTAIPFMKEHSWAKFDETVELAINLAVDPRKANQIVKGVARLPHGNGKLVRVCVFASGPEADAAKEAGADIVGSDELIKAIQSGTINFDRAIATPEMMSQVGKIGKILGPRGLMPNPKMGTVTSDVARAVKAAKAGSVQFRVEKKGIVQLGVGKVSFSETALLENIKSVMLSLQELKPDGIKGKYISKAHISSTMGPGVPLEIASIDPANPKFFVDPSKIKLV